MFTTLFLKEAMGVFIPGRITRSMSNEDKFTICVCLGICNLDTEKASTSELRYTWEQALEVYLDLRWNAIPSGLKPWFKPWWKLRSGESRVAQRCSIKAKIPEMEDAIRRTEDKLLEAGELTSDNVAYERERREESYRAYWDKDAIYGAYWEEAFKYLFCIGCEEGC